MMKDAIGCFMAGLIVLFWVAWMCLIVWGLIELILWIGRN